jgi:hypothetical protein
MVSVPVTPRVPATPAAIALSDLSNVDPLDFLAKGLEAGLGTGSASAFVVDPHDEMFGAKGDAKAFKYCTVSQTNVAYDTIGVSRYTFTSADIGKRMWLATQAGGGVRTIVAVNAGKAVVDEPAPSWYGDGSGQPIVFGTDDTDAIDAALQYAQDLMLPLADITANALTDDSWFTQGATVQLRSGHAYACFNSSARQASGKRGAIVKPRRVALLGSGPGTAILIPPGNYGHGICNASTTTLTDFAQVGNFSLYCFGDMQPAACLDAINFYIPGNTYQWVDAMNRFRDMVIFSPARDGIFMQGRGETILENINILYAGRFGVHFNHFDDYVCKRVNTGGSRKTGIRVESSPAGKWENCKSFYSGALGDTVSNPGGTDADGKAPPLETHQANCANWHLLSDNDFNGRCSFVNCEGQESRGSSWVIESPNNIFTNCKAADPGRAGLGPDTGRPTIVTGFHIAGRFAHGNSFTNTIAIPELGEGLSANWGAATSIVYIDGLTSGKGPQNTKGDIVTLESFVKGSDGTTHTGLNLNGGSLVQGGGTSNTKNTKLKVNGVAVCT